MLKLVDIKKGYGDKTNLVEALKGVNLEFRKSEFVSILGPSGCGKTTLLNIIGGLDKYTTGDLIINGRSTVDFKDKDWDAYRSKTIGFVFQDYNLIAHLSVLGNVELALTISGIKAKERKARAARALEQVGLKGYEKKRPNQLSGGQKQRVAIARAIVNNPDIVLADEPTGALDSKTSVQIMDILKDISKDRLVIMVTHNKEIADTYSTRIISLLDGKVQNDSKPFDSAKEKPEDKLIKVHSGMSFVTAGLLSLKNMFTKKTRTILTAVASSIGIIGIALVLAVSNGFNGYINDMQRDTLSSLPITIDQTTYNIAAMTEEMKQEVAGNTNGNGDMGNDYITSYVPSTSVHYNNIDQKYLDYIAALDKNLYSNISYKYNMDLLIAGTDGSTYQYLSDRFAATTTKFYQLSDNQDVSKKEFPLVSGRYPQSKNEIVLVVDKNNKINTYTLQTLFIGDGTEKDYNLEEIEQLIFSKTYKIILNEQAYTKTNATVFNLNAMNADLYSNANNVSLKIVGIVNNNTASSQLSFGSASEGLAYMPSLTSYIHTENMSSDISKAQKENSSINVMTGNAFIDSVKGSAAYQYKLQLQNLGGYEFPAAVSIYAASFESKDQIKNYLNAYNYTIENEVDKIFYMDTSELITNTFNTIINAVSIVLIVFAAISLLVSSVMIGIITYVSVIERTKEIGVLRSLGARKKDISRVFNSETIIIGLVAGILGILITLILTLPINAIIASLAGNIGIAASVNIWHAVILVAVSTLLTFIAGLIPSNIAARKEPVKCLRSE